MRLASKIFLVSALVILVLCGTVVWSLLTVKRLVTVNQEIATQAVPLICSTKANCPAVMVTLAAPLTVSDPAAASVMVPPPASVR